MKPEHQEYEGHRIEVREREGKPELFIDNLSVLYGQLPNGRYFLHEYAFDWSESLKGTESLITPATCPFTNRSLYEPRSAARARAWPRPAQGPVLESQALKSWIGSLAADPSGTSQIVSQDCLSMTGRRSESQVRGLI